MNELDLLKLALEEYKNAEKIKSNSLELYEQLKDSIFYLLKYSEKYNMPLPKKEALLGMIEKANFLIDQIKPNQPTGNTNKNNREGNRTLYA